ncbi:MAG: ATP-binding protein [Solirubrobacteraceae bacterium]
MIGATVRDITSRVLVGRAAELAELRGALDSAIAGRPGCVLIGGEAGIGKTTLLATLCADAATAGVRVVRGACVDLHGDAPLLPVVEALRRIAADVGEAAWDEAVGDARPQLARLMPELGAPGGADGGPTALLGALLRLTGRLAAGGPLLVALDDAHWADPSTLDLLAFLARNLRDEPVLLVVTFRDDEAERAAWRRWLAEVGRLSQTTRIHLRRLDRDDVTQLLTAIAGGPPTEDLVRRIYARSAGNPFAAEELLAAADGSTALPPTVADLLAGRLAALGEDARELLRLAAAAGDRVEHRLLEAVSSLDADALTAALRDAAEHQLFAPTRDGDRYRFRHPLIAEAAYDELLPGERRRAHAAIAAALAADPGLRAGNAATVAAEIAHHWHRAGDRPRALAAAVRAGQEAVRAYASTEALEQFERALALWDEVEEPQAVAVVSRLDVLEAAAESAVLCGAYQRGVELLDAALAGCTDARSERCRALRRLRAWCLWSSGQIPAALAAYEDAAAGLPDTEATAERAGMIAESALLAGIVGEIEPAERAARRALEMARAVGARREEGEALNALGVALVARGDNSGAIAVMRQGLVLSLEAGRPDDVGRAHANLSDALRRDGELEEAVAVALDGAERARRRGYDLGFGLFVVGNAAEAMLLLGRWDEADRLTARALESAPEGRTAEYLIDLRVLLDVHRGELAEARALVRHITPADDEIAAPEFVCLQAQARIALALAEGDLDAARAAWSGLRAADIAGALDAWAEVVPVALRAEAVRAERGRALRRPAEVDDAARTAEIVWRLSGEAPGAHTGRQTRAQWLTARAEQCRIDGVPGAEAWVVAQNAWDEIGAAPAGAYARYRRAESLLADVADRDAAAALLAEAHATCERLGAAPLRASVEALARRARLELGAPAGEPEVPETASALGLTPRELEVLAHLVDGETNRQIADALFISVKTAGTHVTSILRKLDAHTRGEAAAAALRAGLVPTPPR